MFKRFDGTALPTLEFTFDGARVEAVEGESIAAALLASGVSTLRPTPVSGAPRAPYCMMGACYDCLVEVDGRAVQACMNPVRDGLKVVRLKPVHVEPGDGDGT